jgi:hypothetical protein
MQQPEKNVNYCLVIGKYEDEEMYQSVMWLVPYIGQNKDILDYTKMYGLDEKYGTLILIGMIWEDFKCKFPMNMDGITIVDTVAISLDY